MTKIVNSAAGNSIFDINGNAINNSTYSPDVNAGAIAGVDGSREGFAGYDPVTVNPVNIEYSGTQYIVGIDLDHSPANEHSNLPDNQRQTLRTVKTATAVRNGQWVEYSGVFSPAPSTSDDTSATSLLSDNAAKNGVGTRVTFGMGISNTTTEL